jgi:hypothetical protein
LKCKVTKWVFPGLIHASFEARAALFRTKETAASLKNPAKNAGKRKRREGDSRRFALTPGPGYFDKPGKLPEGYPLRNNGDFISRRKSFTDSGIVSSSPSRWYFFERDPARTFRSSVNSDFEKPHTERRNNDVPPPPLGLLPAGTTIAGRDSHPLKMHAFARRTLI